ncbi:UrcA family protein [Polymorphobacter megasporae]|uniref:UrcA family protein n=1 Tax=Glacieibacterium megasporae TaxID=2835787 RepID=UPI001C1E55EB|nr:UrcA family protein [Polymorphobacter megasporae]UAJ09765.1 UrcA family protein [Polymorphobacter megasporae]
MSNSFARSLIAAASVLTCTVAVAPAAAAISPEIVVQQKTVSYADLDLSSAAGRDTLDHRLRSAANSVCLDASAPIATKACRSAALVDARIMMQRIRSAS